jgi:hypothetical protein
MAMRSRELLESITRDCGEKIMKRRTFDRIVSFVGLALSVLLFVAAGLLNWGAGFANDSVKVQLEQQKITMPAVDSAGFKALSTEAQTALKPFDNQPLTTGKQAQAYADFYIGSHLKGIAGGKVYSEVSGEALAAAAAAKAAPNDVALATKAGALMGQRTTLFMGETLRGLLLNAFAFWQLGQIALYAAYAASIGGVLMLILTLLGFAHIRRVEADATI